MVEGDYTQEAVDAYNMGLGRLWSWFRNVLDCRVKDILLRREKKEKLREERAAALEKHEDWENRRNEAMEVAKEEKQ